MLKQHNELTEYQKTHRESVLKTLQDKMIPHPKDKFVVSPRGKYTLVTRFYKHKEKGFWGYTEGIIYRDDQRLGSFVHNYSDLPVTWICDHDDGHDYLLTAEDYQGQTFIQLDTGRRSDFLSKNAEGGFGFIWRECYVSPCQTMVAVNGCYWGGPPQVKVFDLKDMMNTPPEELFDAPGTANYARWDSDSSLIYGLSYEHNLILDKPTYKETEEEWTLMERLEEEGRPYKELYEDRATEECVWRRE